MPLSAERIHRGRPTPFPWEREALDSIYKNISDNDPHQAWELHELYDPSTGRLYELDLVFLSRRGVFLVEIKSHLGVLRGDIVDWTFKDDTGRQRTIECPYAGANFKARVLAELIERTLGRPRPYVHAAVFVPNATSIHFEGGRPTWLLTKDDVSSKLVNGLDDRDTPVIVNRPMMKSFLQAAQRIGLRPSQTARIVGGYKLGALADDGEGYQEHLARNTVVESDQARVRSYLVPAATSAERRAQLQRAARREAQILAQLGQHPGILTYRSFVDDGPLGPAVIFEAFEDALPLHIFLRQHADLTFDERLGILQQIVEAVAHCHRAGVLHRNLSPSSVLVRRTTEGRIQLRLHRFQTAAWIEHTSVGTRHLHELAQTPDRLYQAPEVLADADKATFESDVFSVGCLAWLLLTDRPPAATLAEREALLNAVPDGEGGLQPSTVRPDLAILDEAIAFATRPNRHSRPDDITVWFDGWVLDPLTRPPATPAVDPHEVQKGDALPGGLTVERRLGKGGTALVLHVRREGRDYALKVPHDKGCGERLLAEARVLRKLRHQHIVALEGVVTFADLPCLLLDFAGDQTLGDLLREQGTLPLDVARRYGDDLLSAVQYLEEQGITHRDIKPTNLGFTTLSKKQPHLVLLDFSLSASDPSIVAAGTAEWRDPWLYLRGVWDAAADRWSTAAVLYHALTGARPEVEEQGAHAGEARIDAERLDAAVRDRLAAFFTRSLARDPAARFTSAENMRHAWAEAFSSTQEAAEDVPAALDLADVRPETPVEALPLSARARNALDRAGVPTVADLLQLPRNHISVIRGVGSKVAKEIVALAEQLRERVPVTAGPALVADFVRPRLALEDVDAGIEPRTRDALFGSGITTTADAAQAPATRIRRLIGDAAAEALRVRLAALAAAEPAPGSPADWARSLIGRASDTEANRRLRVLVGLDPLPEGRSDDGLPAARSVAEVAAAFGVEPAQVHSSLQFLRSKRWGDNEAMKALLQTLSALLESHSPSVPLADLASALATERAGEAASNEDRQLAAALLRVALEARPEPAASWRRIGKVPWVAHNPAVLDGLVALAATADRLAATEPLPSSETVRVRLAEAVAGTPLADMPPDRRVGLAARASSCAAASARLELYPRGMDPGRALGLSLAALAGTGLTPDVVRKRVAARYPEAAPLPERPALDILLLAHGLVFAPSIGAAGGEYIRPGQHAASTSMTVQVPSPLPTTQPGFPSRRSPEAQRASAFQDQLDRGVASRRFRVIQVRADLASPATDALSRALGVPAVSIDKALSEAIRTRAAERKVEWSSVEAADRAGAEGPDWPLLLKLVREAADGLVERLLSAQDHPLLLVWPGGLARYGLSAGLARIVEQAERGDGPAVLLVVPCYADGLPPSINGRLPVPAPLPGQRLVMPDAWLANAHRAAETA